MRRGHCVATSRGVGGTPVSGEAAWPQESQKIFVFYELSLTLNGSLRLFLVDQTLA